jgi:transposase
MSYSQDFRVQVFKIKSRDNLTFEETGERFGVPMRTLFRWQRCTELKTKRNKASTKVDMEALRQDVDQNPDHYQYERAKKFGVCQSTIFYALKRLGISHKKNTVSSQSR